MCSSKWNADSTSCARAGGGVGMLALSACRGRSQKLWAKMLTDDDDALYREDPWMDMPRKFVPKRS